MSFFFLLLFHYTKVGSQPIEIDFKGVCDSDKDGPQGGITRDDQSHRSIEQAREIISVLVLGVKNHKRGGQGGGTLWKGPTH